MLPTQANLDALKDALKLEGEGIDYYLDGGNMPNWGHTIALRGYALLPQQQDKMRFQIVMEDCRDIYWQIYTHIAQEKIAPTQIVAFKEGRAQHRSPLNILTEHFGGRVFYGALTIERV
jgi:hypothetical protein